MNDLPIVLTARDAVVADISTPPEEQHFDAEPDVESGNVEVRLGRSPVFIDLSERSRVTGQALAPELQYLQSRFKVVLITTSVSVLRLKGIRSVSALAYSLDFDSKADVAIVDLLPKPEIVDVARVHLSTDSSVTAEADAKGQFSVKIPGTEVATSAGIGSENKAGILASFQYTVHSVRTQAIGLYGKTAIWNLVSEGRPIIGDFIFGVTILVDQLIESLKFRSQISVTISKAGFFPEKRASGWHEEILKLKLS
jgi:hypothetical protein